MERETVQWNFYFSGILYGRLFEERNSGQAGTPPLTKEEKQAGNRQGEEGLLFAELLDIKTGLFGERKKFGKEEDEWFRGLCSRSLLSFFEKRAAWEALMEGGPEEFLTKEGERFFRRTDGSYIQREKKFPFDLFCDEEGEVRRGEGKKRLSVYAVCMAGRDFCGVLVRAGMEGRTILREWKQELGSAFGQARPVRFFGSFFVPTRDGERLATDVYLPGDWEDGDNGRFPAVLVRTPYGKGRGKEVYFRFVQRGYAAVIQDTRGREDSTGEWLPEYYEVEDGDDTLNWIASQDWSDGQVSMTGGSYLGYVQWAAAASGNPHLKAMLSSVCAGSAFVDIPRRGGCFNSGMLAWAFAMSEQRMRPDLMSQDNWDEILDIRPLSDIPLKALGHPIPFLEKWLAHRDMDDFWKRSSWKERYSAGPVPALIMSGWFDDNGMGTTEALELTKSWPEGTYKAVLGPWKHSGNADYDLHGLYVGENALRYDMDLLCMKWLEHFLRGAENGVETSPAVEYYTLGENRWKTASAWPPKETSPVFLYLDGPDGTGEDHSAAGTGSRCGAGRLSSEPPRREGKDSYLYDPQNPSLHLADMSENELEVPGDYTQEEKRQDILSYSTVPLQKPLTVTGDLRVRLYVSCSCPDADFMVRLTDVDENGRSVKLADGVLGAKYRNGFEQPEYMRPGEVCELCIRTTKISNTFLPGHRLRLTLTSSAKNFIFPNSGTEEGFDSCGRQTAEIAVYRGGITASRLELPCAGWEGQA